MKKLYAAVFAFVMLFSISAFAEGRTVVDEADYLTDSEEIALEERLDEIKSKHSIDAAVVIVNTIGEKTAEEYADDYYDYNGYGLGVNDDGILLLISKMPRKYHITTHKKAVQIFNDEAIDALKSAVESDLRNDDYYEACISFADMVDEMSAMYESGQPYGETNNAGYICISVLAASIIIAAIMTNSAYKGMNTAVVQADADNYEKKGSFKLTKSNDVFLYSNVTKTKIESSSSGGGSTHRSSSGRSHGGGGGSY